MLTLRLLLAARDGRDEELATRLDAEAERASELLGAGSRGVAALPAARVPCASSI